MLYMKSVTKKIRQKYLADALDLHAEEGSLYALVGPSGSGKTSALKLCSGILKPDAGTIVIHGISMKYRENRKKWGRLIGYMDEHNGVYPNLSVLEYLEFYTHVYGYYGLSARERCLEVLRMAGMERRADTPMENLPESTLRQLEFLRTLLHRPPLLLLDNPFAGMDMYERLLTQEILSQLASEGTTIVLTSESIPEILEFSHQIGVMGEGRMLAEGTREEVMDKIRAIAPLYLEVRNEQEKTVRMLRDNPRVQSLTWDRNYFVVHFAGNQEQEARLLKELIDEGIEICSFHRGEGSLEDLSSHLI